MLGDRSRSGIEEMSEMTDTDIRKQQRSGRQWTWWAGGVLIAVLTLAACSSVVQSANLESSDTQLPADFEIVVYQGHDELGGDRVLFSQLLQDGRPVVLNMWAGLCPACRLEMPDFQRSFELYCDEVLFLGLDVGPFFGLGTNEDGQALLQESDVTYPAGSVQDAGIVSAYRLVGVPSTYFITADGEVYEQWIGLLNEAKLAELIKELLVASEAS
jgi:thiol-disulfide isomerase/thioredoxin